MSEPQGAGHGKRAPARLGTTLCRARGAARERGPELCGARAQLLGGGASSTLGAQLARGGKAQERGAGGDPGWGGSAHHLRTFSMVAITFLMSSLARLRVSARTVRPAMLAGLGPGPSPRRGCLPSGGLRLGARPGSRARRQPSLRELAAPSLAPQRLRESPPRFLPPRPAPARPRSGWRAARAAGAQAWQPGPPRSAPGPPPRGARTRSAPCPPPGTRVGGPPAPRLERAPEAVRSGHVGARLHGRVGVREGVSEALCVPTVAGLS